MVVAYRQVRGKRACWRYEPVSQLLAGTFMPVLHRLPVPLSRPVTGKETERKSGCKCVWRWRAQRCVMLV